MYFIHVFYAQKSLQNSPKTTFAVTVIFSAPQQSYCTATAGPCRRRQPRAATVGPVPLPPAPCRHCSFLITTAAFGSSLVKKGGGGLGLGWWWLRI